MERVAEERQYVLMILHHMREEIVANPDSFDVNALARIDESVAFLQPEEDETQAA
ncbi:MAG TPA: hypothetical protein VFJ47_07995 [Terriglobales bacterium]|nr:hypothetical protein [Terriglobales bacterium]